MSTLKSSNNKPLENSAEEFDSDKQNNDKTNTNNNNRVRSSTKRPRAPIACFRCHHKKVRCDGARPNCTRCLSTGVLCAYPSSRRSRTTQPTNVDPFIDNLSHLEARIRQIESDLASQRTMVHSILSSPGNMSDSMNVDNETIASTANELNSKMMKTEMEVQDSRSILAQLRLRGEQRILRGKRAAAAAAASSKAKTVPKEEKTKQKQPNTKFPANRTKQNTKAKKSNAVNADNDALGDKEGHSSFFYQNMMLDNNTTLDGFHTSPPGHGMDWTLFDQDHKERSQPLEHRNDLIVNSSDPVYDSNYLGAMANTNLFFPTGSAAAMTSEMMAKSSQNMTSMVMDTSPASTRSSSLTSNLGFPVILQPSNSTNSTTSNMTTSNTSCSSFNSCDNIFNFSMEGVMLQSNPNEAGQDMDMLCNNPSSVWYYT